MLLSSSLVFVLLGASWLLLDIRLVTHTTTGQWQGKMFHKKAVYSPALTGRHLLAFSSTGEKGETYLSLRNTEDSEPAYIPAEDSERVTKVLLTEKPN